MDNKENKKYSKQALILIYPGFQNAAKQYQYGRIKEELSKSGIKTDIIKIDEFFTTIKDGAPNIDVTKYDFCVQLVQDRYINTFLEKKGIKSFNTLRAIENCNDKMLTISLLAGHGVGLPKTVAGFCNNTGIETLVNIEVPKTFKDYVESILKYPLVAKKSHSKRGNGVYKIENRKMLDEICEQLKGTPHLFQEYVAIENAGKDIRVTVVGGKVVGAFMRINNADFRSSTGEDIDQLPYMISANHKMAVEKAAQVLGLDYCSVDFFLTENPIICEVNHDPTLVDTEEVSKTNIAKLLVEHIVSKVY